MHKPTTLIVTTAASGLLLLGMVYGQQQTTPPATAQNPPAKSTTSQTKKPGTTSTTPKKTTPLPLTLSTPKDKASYAYGLNMGEGMRKNSIDLDPTIIYRGLKDGLAGGKTLLTDEEARAAVMAFQTDLRQKQQAKMQALAESNKKEGDAFLAANKEKEGVVTLPSGLQYKILQPGDGPKPAASDVVNCNYRGTLLDNTEFDSSAKHGSQPATFPVTQVIRGWTEALQLMPVGSKWQLFVPPDLAYGTAGRPGIPPNATLVFEVELVSIRPKTPPSPSPAPEATPTPNPNPPANPTPPPNPTPSPNPNPTPPPNPKPAPPPNPTPPPAPNPTPTPTPTPTV